MHCRPTRSGRWAPVFRLGRVGVAGALLTGCGPAPELRITDPAFAAVADDLQLGMLVGDLRSARPGFHISKDGTYGEWVRNHQFAYLFVPKETDEPPPLSARLVGVERWTEVYDTVALWSEWQRDVEAHRARLGVDPTCTRFTGPRFTHGRATFEGSPSDGALERHVTATLQRSPDGRTFEAFLVVRVETGEFVEADEEATPWNAVPCDLTASAGS